MLDVDSEDLHGDIYEVLMRLSSTGGLIGALSNPDSA